MNADIKFFDFLYILVTKFINTETILYLGALWSAKTQQNNLLTGETLHEN